MPKAPTTTKCLVSLTPDLVKWLHKAAHRRNMTKSAIVIEALSLVRDQTRRQPRTSVE